MTPFLWKEQINLTNLYTRAGSVTSINFHFMTCLTLPPGLCRTDLARAQPARFFFLLQDWEITGRVSLLALKRCGFSRAAMSKRFEGVPAAEAV